MRKFTVTWFGTLAVVISFLAVQIFVPVKGQAADLGLGKKVYKAKCQKCHGPGGKGDGPKAEDLETEPKDFTEPGYLSKYKDDELKELVLEGEEPRPVFRGKLKDKELEAVIAFVKAFEKK